jgi:hypothetical protein
MWINIIIGICLIYFGWITLMSYKNMKEEYRMFYFEFEFGFGLMLISLGLLFLFQFADAEQIMGLFLN